MVSGVDSSIVHRAVRAQIQLSREIECYCESFAFFARRSK